MANPYPIAENILLDDINTFRRYRNPNGGPHINAWTPQDLATLYRKSAFPAPNPANPVQPALPDFPGWPPAAAAGLPAGPVPLTEDQKDFIARTMPRLDIGDTSPLDWQGTMFLGHGGNGNVGLWEVCSECTVMFSQTVPFLEAVFLSSSY